MYGKSIVAFIRLLPVVAAVIGGEFVLQIFEELWTSTSSGMMFARTLVWSYLAYAAHAEFLLSAERDKSEDNRRVFSFAARSLALSMLVVLTLSMLMGGLMSLGMNANLVGKGGLLFIIVLVVVPSTLLVFSLLGTVLPAFVTNYERGISAAFSRGKSQFFWSTRRLLIGPGAIMTAGLIISILAAIMIDGNGNLLGPDYFSSLLMAVLLLIVSSINALATIMTAWILSSAFKRCYGVAY